MARSGGTGAQITQAGWSGVRWRNLTAGIVALHAGYKPAERSISFGGVGEAEMGWGE